MKESKLCTFKKKYRILDTIEMFVSTLDEKAYYPKEGCVAVSEAILSGGMKFPLYPFFRLLLMQYNLAPT